MVRSLAAALMLLLPSASRADMSPIPQRHVPVMVTIIVDRDHPEYEFFLVDGNRHQVERMPLTPSNPVVLKSEDRGGHLFGLSVHAVPKAELAVREQTGPPLEGWLERSENRKFFAGSLYVRGRVEFTDNRDRIETTYLLRILPDSCRLEPVSENKGSPWVKAAWAGLCCVLPPAAIIWLGFWIVGRFLLRRRSQ